MRAPGGLCANPEWEVYGLKLGVPRQPRWMGTASGRPAWFLAAWFAVALFAAANTLGAGPDGGRGVSAEGQGSAQPEIRIEVREGMLTLEARDVPLADMLRQLGERLGFRSHLMGDLDERVSLSVHDVPPDEVIRRVLGERSYIIIYAAREAGNGARVVKEVRVFGTEGTSRAASADTRVRLDRRKARMTRLEGVEELGREQTPEAARELEGLVADDPDIHIRRAAAIALGRYGDPRTIETLTAALGDPSPWVRMEALRSLGGIGSQEAVQTFELVIATDADERVRDLASRLLDWLGKQSSMSGATSRN